MRVEETNSVLVTGGRGFIGRTVGQLLRQSGFKVVSLDQTAIVDLDNPGEVLCDISDREQLQRVFESQPINDVIHLAAVLPTAAQRQPVRATQVNVVGSANLLDLARQFEVRRFVFASSLSIYGTWEEAHVVSESDHAAPEDLYGAAKLYVEQLGAAYRDRHGLDFVSLRIGRVIGAGANSATSAWRGQIFEFLRAGYPVEIQIPYIGSERVLLVNVRGVARALVSLLNSDRTAHHVYNAPCESVVVQDLKREVEKLNANITVNFGGATMRGNPRVLDFSRFQEEFGFQPEPIFYQLRKAAGEQAGAPP